MEREEQERLLAGYVNGTLSPADRRALEQKMEQDPGLCAEGDELAALWDTMDAGDPAYPGNDAAFYSMLEAAKSGQQKNRGRIVSFPLAWIRTAAAVAACIAAFVIGRYGIEPKTETRTRTVYVKVPSPATPLVVYRDREAPVSSTAPNTGQSPKAATTVANETPSIDPAIEQRLRSVFPSERMAAINALFSKGKPGEGELKLLKVALEEDPNANVRLTIVNALRPLAGDQKIQTMLIASLNGQGNALVQSSMIDLLVEVRATRALPQMIALLDDTNTNTMVQSRIRDGVQTFLN